MEICGRNYRLKIYDELIFEKHDDILSDKMNLSMRFARFSEITHIWRISFVSSSTQLCVVDLLTALNSASARSLWAGIARSGWLSFAFRR